MTLDEWIETIPEDERDTLCVADGWNAGATAMLNELIKWGFIAGTARKEVKDILKEGTHEILSRMYLSEVPESLD